MLNGVILQDEIDLKPEDLVSGDAKMLIASAIPGLTAESIESFKVLKDASATAVYGPRAIAGVVVVTTKKGTSGSSSITYTNESTFRMIPSYNQYNIMNLPRPNVFPTGGNAKGDVCPLLILLRPEPKGL